MTNRQKRRAHFKTIALHRKYVKHWCFKLGFFWQGLIHDLSKYSKEEFSIYKYYTGTKSPHEAARDILGYSPSWFYHKNKNKHHWEFWLDNQDSKMTPVKIPFKYVIEMFCDFVGAGKAYMKDAWTTRAPLDYYETKCKGKRLLHKESEKLLVTLLSVLATCNIENQFFTWYKKHKKHICNTYIHDIK